jgi:TRAP-type C4-dicarboxylate transport system permease small subunit
MTAFERFDRLLTLINIVLIGAMTTLVTVAVVLRYVFSVSFAWSEELIALTFLVSSALGSVSAVRRGDHIAIDFLSARLSGRPAKIARIGVSLAVILTMGVMIDASLIWIGVNVGVPTPAMQLPYVWFYSVLPVSFALIAAYEAVAIVDVLRTFASEGGR